GGGGAGVSGAEDRSSSTLSGGSSAGSGRGSLGAGLVEIPPIQPSDPASAVLANPEVPERMRFCGSCGQPVGRDSAGRVGRIEGFCKNCGSKFSVQPKLKPGEHVARQYDGRGALAHR